MSMSWQDDVILAFDTETTGLKSDAEIVELGVVHYYRGNQVREWSSFFMPRFAKRDDPDVMKAMEINKIDWEELLIRAPTFRKMCEDVQKELSEAVWVAHNAEFDVRMISQEYKRLETEQRHPPRLVLCTKLLDFMINPGQSSYKLEAVAQRWGVMQLGAHRAVVDAKTCGEILARMIRIKDLPKDIEGMQAFMKEADKKWRSRPKGVW